MMISEVMGKEMYLGR